MGKQIVKTYPDNIKQCRKCRENKPLCEFWPMPHNRHGYTVMCKDCYRGAPVGMKQCRKCGQQKHESDFNRLCDEKCPDGLRHQCKKCRNKVRNKWRDKNKDSINCKKMEAWHSKTDSEKSKHFKKRSHKVFVWKLETRFGITLSQYEDMVSKQGNCCAICGVHASEACRTNPDKRLYVDHCHRTGVVRGLLCNLCNVGLGSFRDSADVMSKAISYLSSQQEMTEG